MIVIESGIFYRIIIINLCSMDTYRQEKYYLLDALISGGGSSI